MTMIDVALASCLDLPEPDPDEAPLLHALRERGLSAATWAWGDDTVDWSEARLVLLRSTWNYYLDRARFLAWARRVATLTNLHNPVDVIAWNTHKRYLLELAQLGVDVVPTELVTQGNTAIALTGLCRQRGWQRVVVKPAVAAASFGAYATAVADIDESRFAAAVSARDMLVQPFVDSVNTRGERSIIVIDGQITHSVCKQPRFADDAENVTGPVAVAADDAALVRAVLAAMPHDRLLYARVDVVRDAAGAPMVSELELTEPSLFFSFSIESVGHMVTALEQLLTLAGRQ